MAAIDPRSRRTLGGIIGSRTMQTSGSLLTAVSLYTTVVVGLSAWLGRVWAARIAADEQAKHAAELQQLATQLQILQTQTLRVSEARFNLYCDVWSKLQDVRTFGDRLWVRADTATIELFRQALESARLAVNRGRLILREEHYQSLLAAFQSFESYEIGKQTLIEIRSRAELDQSFVGSSEALVQAQIHKNADRRANYENVLNTIAPQFRLEIGLTIPEKRSSGDVPPHGKSFSIKRWFSRESAPAEEHEV